MLKKYSSNKRKHSTEVYSRMFYLKSTFLCVTITFNNFLIIGNPLDDLGIFLDLLFDFFNGYFLLVEGL